MRPIRLESIDSLLIHVNRQVHTQGWSLVCAPVQGFLYTVTIGLESNFSHPELETLGLTETLAQDFLTALAERIKAGERFSSGDFFSNLVKGYDLLLVRNPLDPDGKPLTGHRLRLVWPDALHRYPWHPDCDAQCALQRLILPEDGLTLEGMTRAVVKGHLVS
ncbi:MAG: DUF4262 domain-containing protein [Deltaproteobacteria bacterium]|nr:DUF4262 domain-containing protein [Deltaproteobacteria bacterium]